MKYLIALLIFLPALASKEKFISVRLPVMKAISYKIRMDYKLQTTNYYYFIEFDKRNIYVNAELREGHVENFKERIDYQQKVANGIKKLKTKYGEKRISVKFRYD